MNFKRTLLGAFAAIAIGTVAFAQSGFFGNWPIVGGSSYSCGSVNGVSNCTVPAGPTVLTGNENVPANANLNTGASAPQSILIPMAALNSLPVTISASNATANYISASALTGGYMFTAAGGITTLNVSLPPNAIQGQQFVISSNRSITTLTVSPQGSDSIGGNSAPTALTASLTAPQGYRFIYDKATTTWYRLQ